VNSAVVEARAPSGAAEWSAYYALRWRILRAPWQAGGPERDPTDDTSVHRLVCNARGRVLAVGRLHRIEGTTTAQFRFMAVDSDQQRKGYGTLLLGALEQAARDRGLDTVILQARENAVPFYRRHGYQVQEKTFLLFDEIQHYLMSKRLDG
jgi:GNAT superfamily N-acetyltransferase